MSDRIGSDIRRYYESVVVRFDPTQPLVTAPKSNWKRGTVIALAAAIVTALTVGVTALLRPSETPVVGTTTTTADQITETTSAATPTTLVETAATTRSELPAAPWSGPKLAPTEVDTLLLDAWSQAANRGYCSLLAPADLGSEGEHAVPRLAGFTPDQEWYVAWDNPDGPGMTGGSEGCDDCGRSAFGIHGSFLLNNGLGARWSDGSGMVVFLQDFQVYTDGHHRALANLVVAGQSCSYQVWSSLGEEHLVWFVDQLRFVDGYYSEPIEPGFGDVTITNLGDPPWAKPPIRPEEVETLLLERWAEAATGECPLLALANLGSEADQATIRTANFGGWGVAWDNPDGPGHDGFNGDCSDCGRGVVGLSGGRGGPIAPDWDIPPFWPYRAEWNDGSYASYGYEFDVYNLLPPDRIDTRDPQTGDPTTPPVHANLTIADHPNCQYEVWTHLGTEHLHYLFTQLRYVSGHP